jgi:DNA polymerase III epsilon subunit-like protein
MEYIVLGIEAIQRVPAAPEVLEVAAVWIDQTGREAACFQTYVNPGMQTLEKICPKTFQAVKDDVAGLENVLDAVEAARGLRAFLDTRPVAQVHAFNIDRAKRLLGKAPWNLNGRFGTDIRSSVLEILMEREGWDDDSAEAKNLKLYDAAKAFGVPVPERRRALSDARMGAEILGKIKGMKDTIRVTRSDSIREAAYLLEDGL